MNAFLAKWLAPLRRIFSLSELEAMALAAGAGYLIGIVFTSPQPEYVAIAAALILLAHKN